MNAVQQAQNSHELGSRAIRRHTTYNEPPPDILHEMIHSAEPYNPGGNSNAKPRIVKCVSELLNKNVQFLLVMRSQLAQDST